MRAISGSARTRSCSRDLKEADLVLLVGGRLLRNPLAGLHAPRHSRARARRSCTCMPTPTSSAASIARASPINASPTAFAAALDGLQPPAAIPWRAAHRRGACGLSRLERPGGDPPSRARCRCRSRDGASARDAPGRHDLLQRRRQLRDLGPPLLAVPRLRHAARADLRLDGLRHAGGGRREADRARTARSSCFAGDGAS